MAQELISKKTRNALREVLVGWVLREIEMAFEEAGIRCDRSFNPPVDGARRSFVEQHYQTMDFANADDAKRLLVVLEGVLHKASRNLCDRPDQFAQRKLDDLIQAVKGDGFVYSDGQVSPATPATHKAFSQAPGRSISEVTRRNIADTLEMNRLHWSGRLEEDTFLGRLYDLKSLPSYDQRCKTAGEDIHRHTVMNNDWDSGWVFSDARFGLMNCDDEAFLRFLCEMVHPVVRPDVDETRKLVGLFNDHLARDGWDIHESDSISGRPVFQARRKSSGFSVAKQVKVLAKKVDSDYIARQTTRMTEAVEDDPELAIGTAKELVETVCKTILHERGVEVAKNADLPELNKALFKALRLVPEDIPDHAKGSATIRKILQNLATVTQGLAELRNLYGTGHGKHGGTKSINPRHARLAVGASSTLAAFLYETHLHNRGAEPK